MLTAWVWAPANRKKSITSGVLLQNLCFEKHHCGSSTWGVLSLKCLFNTQLELLTGYTPILWCWRRLLRVPWTARRSNQSILKEISPEYSLEGLMLKQKLQYFGHLMQRTDSLEKTLLLSKIEGRRRRGRQGMRRSDGITWLNGHEFVQALGVDDGQESSP